MSGSSCFESESTLGLNVGRPEPGNLPALMVVGGLAAGLGIRW